LDVNNIPVASIRLL